MKKKILITGGAGFLAQNIFKYLNDNFDLYLTFYNTKPNITYSKYFKTNLENYYQIKNLISNIKPDYIINTAGLTNVEECKKKKAQAYKKNVQIVYNLSKICKINKIKFIHISTDHLFEGNNLCYKEIDKPKPLNTYAKTKFLAEKIIKKKLKNYIIIRSNFFGWDKKGSKKFFSWIFESLQNKKNIKLYSDVFFSPVSSFVLSKVITKLIKNKFLGTINVSSNERVSKYDFAILLAKIFNFKTKYIQKIKYKDLDTKIKRPFDMTLSNSKLKKIIKIKIPKLNKQIQEISNHRFKGVFDDINPIIQYGKHNIDQNDCNQVVNLMKNLPLTQSKEIERFENNVADYVGSKYAVAVSSCSAGMHLACKVLNLNHTNELITSPISFVSTANAGLHCGSKINFADVNSESLNITAETVNKVLNKNSKKKIILPVHFGGNPDNTKSIYKKFKNNKIIEDAAHSFGAKYNNGKMVGSCQYSDMTVFSFHPVKTITTAEGGMITTNNKNYYERLLALRSHGIVKDKKYFKNKANDSPWYYEVTSLSNHYRITDLQCALGNSQLEKIEQFIDKRRKLAEIYFNEFSNFSNLRVGQKFNKNSSYHLFIIRISFENLKFKRQELMKILRVRGIGSQVHYIPIPLHPLYKNIFKKNLKKALPNAMNYYNEALSIPIYYDLTLKEQKNIINTLKDIVG